MAETVSVSIQTSFNICFESNLFEKKNLVCFGNVHALHNEPAYLIIDLSQLKNVPSKQTIRIGGFDQNEHQTFQNCVGFP